MWAIRAGGQENCVSFANATRKLTEDLRRDDEPRQVAVQKSSQGALDEVLTRVVRGKSNLLYNDIYVPLNQALNCASY